MEVEGNELYDAKVIEKVVLNDDYSWNSLYVYLKYRFVSTRDVPFVDTMEITLKDPQTLHIKVYEKGMMGYLYISSIDENAYFDKDGPRRSSESTVTRSYCMRNSQSGMQSFARY